ncbi:chloride channel protein [Halocynthiibacter sp. C4]|uniref:chloride channel protein n=1 Tax=Halocynthiibacter sp. C4 TaxID=2992758 RepID=UPI00237BC576|nr:chloride channel protein [Halocynthiibacter sp. C4]MDE0589216.1 chloride channel protein [Halocynthiibacter sp. C4]
MKAQIKDGYQRANLAVKDALRIIRQEGPNELQFWFIALLIGIGAGFTALYFRKAILALQGFLYDAETRTDMLSVADRLPWYWILLVPIVGGLIVGILLNKYTPDGRVRSVADVIEGAALHHGRVERREGLASGLASLITLSSGGSTGREGPVVHLAAVISTWVSNRIHASGIDARDLLGCAVAAAVSASFNAPIAGALFALEVILRHFAVHAFAPIVIASVAGTVISRLEFGNVTEFQLMRVGELAFYVELPAFLLLGIISGLVAVVLMKSIFWADNFGNVLQKTLRIPAILRPAIAGGLLGGIAIFFPHIIGVGYGTTSAALSGDLLFREAVVFAVLKAIAVAITMAGRMGGGVFSPAMMLGALTGLAFGLIATQAFPNVSGSHTIYALAGMGAVAAAVLGAPISTTLIVFELTGDWQTGLAVMAAVSVSTAISSRMVDKSFFLTQLERRDVHLAAGPQGYLLSTIRVKTVMRPLGEQRCADEADCDALVKEGRLVGPEATLEEIMPEFEAHDLDFIPVVAESGALLGAIYHVDALLTFNRALSETAAEEHS